MWRIALLALAIFMAAPVALAATLTPTARDVVVTPANQDSTSFVVRNTSSTTEEYTVALYDVIFTDDGAPTFAPLQTNHAAWFSVNATSFTLEAGEQQQVLVTVAVPANASAQTFTVAALVSDVAPVSGVSLATAVSGLIFVTVGDLAAEAQLLDFSAVSSLALGLPIDFSAVIANDGERIVQPVGAVRIRNIFGEEVVRLNLNPVLSRVLSGSHRTFVTTWPQAVSANFFVELWREVSGQRAGVFTAELIMVPYPGSSDTIVASTRFVIVPWRTITVLAGICGALLVYRRRRH